MGECERNDRRIVISDHHFTYTIPRPEGSKFGTETWKLHTVTLTINQKIGIKETDILPLFL